MEFLILLVFFFFLQKMVGKIRPGHLFGVCLCGGVFLDLFCHQAVPSGPKQERQDKELLQGQ